MTITFTNPLINNTFSLNNSCGITNQHKHVSVWCVSVKQNHYIPSCIYMIIISNERHMLYSQEDKVKNVQCGVIKQHNNNYYLLLTLVCTVQWIAFQCHKKQSEQCPFAMHVYDCKMDYTKQNNLHKVANKY